MRMLKKLYLIIISLIVTLSLVACTKSTTTGTTTTTGSVPGGAVVNSDSIVTAKIESITQQTTGQSWKLTILIQTALDVGSLPNSVKDKINQIVTAYCDEDLSAYKVGNIVVCHIKYGGDVNIPGGIILIMSDVALQTSAGGY
jgi:hypothetical protein